MQIPDVVQEGEQRESQTFLSSVPNQRKDTGHKLKYRQILFKHKEEKFTTFSCYRNNTNLHQVSQRDCGIFMDILEIKQAISIAESW